MDHFQERREELQYLQKNKYRKAKAVEPVFTEKLFFQCKKCDATTANHEFSAHLYICPHCGEHYRMNAPRRIRNLLDPDTFRETNPFLVSDDPLDFPEYKEKAQEITKNAGVHEAVVTGLGKIGGIPIAIGVMDTRYFMGSMGVAVGEKITQLIELATRRKLPLILVCASGGARMQEGILSLMQMAKTASAIERHSKAGLLYLSVLTNPTTGGVTASFASLADITLAEPRALIGFAGPRVIEQTIKQTLPEGFQRSEYLQDHGLVDRIVPRAELRAALTLLLQMHTDKTMKKAKNLSRGG
ncbi:MAG: acetyl-CoA carboxylase, carboxyltransferase subunit beta [Eubacteriales bacterium]